MALSLGLDEAFFDGKLEDPCAQMVMLKYPPALIAEPAAAATARVAGAAAGGETAAGTAAANDSGEGPSPAAAPAAATVGSDDFVATGCGAHTDCGFLTILCQSEDGLDVRHKRCGCGVGDVVVARAVMVVGEAWTGGSAFVPRHAEFVFATPLSGPAASGWPHRRSPGRWW